MCTKCEDKQPEAGQRIAILSSTAWKCGKGYGCRKDSAGVVERCNYGWEARKLGAVIGIFRLRAEAIATVDEALIHEPFKRLMS